MKTTVKTLALASMLVLTTGCATKGEQRVLTGAAIGAGTGALIAGNSGQGALIGAGVGAAGGYLYHKQKGN